MNNIDISIFLWLNAYAGVSPVLDGIIVFLAESLWYLVTAAAAVILLVSFLPRWSYLKKRHLELLGITFFSAIMARFVITEFIRLIIPRPRPFEILEFITPLILHDPGASFPSGHASFVFAIAAAVFFYYPRLGVLFFFAAFFTGLGRVIAGVHWPSDILAGAMVGIATSWFMIFAFRKYLKSGLRRFKI